MSRRKTQLNRNRRARFEPLEDRRMLSVSPEWLVTLGGDALLQLPHAAGHVVGGLSVAGHFDSSHDFDPGPGEEILTAGGPPWSGPTNVVVARYTDAGDLHWAMQTHSISSNHFQLGTGVATDRGGNTYVLGVFAGSVQIGTYGFTGDSRDGFVAKLDAGGNVVWAQPLRATSSDLFPRDVQGISVDDRDADPANWSVFVSGQFSGTLTVGEGGPSYATTGKKSASNIDGFVSRFSAADGAVGWTRLLAGNGNQTTTALAVAISGTPALYVSGDFATEAKIGSVTLTGPTGSHFLAKLNPTDGSTIWAKSAAVAATGGSLATTGDSVLVAGEFSGTVDFDPSTGGVNNLSSIGGRDIGLVKLDSTGSFQWARRMGSGEDETTGKLSIGADGHIFLTGQFGGFSGNPADFGSQSFISNGPDGFLTELDASGSFLGTYQFSDQGFSTAVDGANNVYVTGFFSGLEYTPFVYPFDHFPTGESFTTQRSGASLMKFSSTAPPIDMTPRIDGFRPTPEKVAPGEPVTLSVVGVHDPDRQLRSARFYRDIDGDGELNTSIDQLLGEVSTPTTEQERSAFIGVGFSASTAGLLPGTYKYFAQAFDSNDNVLTDAAETVVTIPAVDEDEYPSTNVPKAIGGKFSLVTSTVVVPDEFTILDLNVTLNINHTYNSDLVVSLIGPDGTRILLFTRVGGSGDNFQNTTLDDEAAISIVNGTPPFSGSFNPQSYLSDFDGKNAAGIWTLEIRDVAGADKGTLNGWSLTFTREAAAGSSAAAQGAALDPHFAALESSLSARPERIGFAPAKRLAPPSDANSLSTENRLLLTLPGSTQAISHGANDIVGRSDTVIRPGIVDAALAKLESDRWPKIVDEIELELW